MRKILCLYSVAAAALAACFDATPAAAQPTSDTLANSIAEVVVTARRREENVQDVPLTVQAFSQEMLEQKGVAEVRDLKYAVPGLTVSPGTFRDSTPSMAIRGFAGQGLQIDQDPSIPFILNEVPINTPQGQNAAFFDLQSVQVLKGPQGTLQGRNTVGGAVLITSRPPVLEVFGGRVSAGLGNYDARAAEAVLNVPLGDRIAVRLAGRRELRDGTWTNIRDGRDYDDRNSWAGRASILMKFSDTIENLTVFDGVRAHTHGSAIVFQAKGFDFNDTSTYPTGGQGDRVYPCERAAQLRRRPQHPDHADAGARHLPLERRRLPAQPRLGTLRRVHDRRQLTLRPGALREDPQSGGQQHHDLPALRRREREEHHRLSQDELEPLRGHRRDLSRHVDDTGARERAHRLPGLAECRALPASHRGVPASGEQPGRGFELDRRPLLQPLLRQRELGRGSVRPAVLQCL